nr:hypothetical protein [Tanacetum cinerariifolium]
APPPPSPTVGKTIPQRLGRLEEEAPLPPREQRHPFLRYQGLEYTNADIADIEERDVLNARMLMEHLDDGGVVVFTSGAWTRLFDIRGPLVRELILEFPNALRFGEAPEKVTVADLFYLRGLNVGSVNISYLLACYLRRFAAGRKSRALISGG